MPIATTQDENGTDHWRSPRVGLSGHAQSLGKPVANKIAMATELTTEMARMIHMGPKITRPRTLSRHRTTVAGIGAGHDDM
ncbi:hypothetical protein [Nocardia sp. XZ_19_231]|uniref:hypothetical protein n=1 Tax=Nocardia sp. XZ_19_231 TaxID=2769252 RepID=UPI00188F49E7|nr:hypothetical protein [Nocardia sp. XZ_19_231]